MKKQISKSAFSLVELSIVILIIGIVLAGITQSSRLIRQFKLSSARTLTESSPVNSIPDLVMWFDATKEESTIGANNISELENGDEVLTWKSMTAASVDFNVTATSGTGPQYIEEGINELPALLFDKSDVDERMTGDFAGYNFEWTMFLVIRKLSTNASSSDILTITGVTSGHALIMNINNQGKANAYAYYVPDLVGQVLSDAALSNSTNYLLSYSFSPSKSQSRLYLNQVRQNSLNDTTASDPGMATASIAVGGHINANGAVFDGYIGEIISYNRALKTEERTAVENYLTDKWGL